MANYRNTYGYGYGNTNKDYYSNNEVQSQSEEKYSSGHVCRPVIVDSDGRKRPIICYNHTETENVHKQSSPVHDYGVSMEKLVINSPYPYPNYPQKVEEFVTTIQTEVTRPVKFGHVSANQWRQSSNPSNGNGGYGGYGGNGGGDDYYKKTDDYYKPSNNPVRNQYSDDYYNKPNGNSVKNQYSDDYYNKPNGNSVKNQYSDDYYNKPNGNSVKNQYSDDDYRTENGGGYGGGGRAPAARAIGAAARQPNHVRWAAPVSQDLSQPTNDIGTAVEFLKETAKTFSGATTGGGTASYSRYTERDDMGTIDSREASRRYGNYKLPLRPYAPARESYTSDITSREASKRYGGASV